jgi:hypothetical protein
MHEKVLLSRPQHQHIPEPTELRRRVLLVYGPSMHREYDVVRVQECEGVSRTRSRSSLKARVRESYTLSHQRTQTDNMNPHCLTVESNGRFLTAIVVPTFQRTREST